MSGARNNNPTVELLREVAREFAGVTIGACTLRPYKRGARGEVRVGEDVWVVEWRDGVYTSRKRGEPSTSST